MMSLDIWVVVCAFVVIVSGAFLLRRGKSRDPYFSYSSFGIKKASPSSWRVRSLSLPMYGKIIALLCCTFALMDIRWEEEEENIPSYKEEVSRPREGIALYLAIDRSGSMKKKVYGDGFVSSRLEYVKSLTKEFIRGRDNDLIGLIAFARKADVVVPLTFDHSHLIEKITALDVARDVSEEGTAIGYTLVKAAHIMKATAEIAEEDTGKAYEIQRNVLVIITDGVQNSNIEDAGERYRAMGLLDAAEYAKKYGVRTYIVAIDPAVKKATLEYEQLQHAAAMTGGKLYVADDDEMLVKIYQEVNAIEKSILPHQDTMYITKPLKGKSIRVASAFPHLINIAMLVLFVAVMLETTLLRRIP
jgi:Ca-activated chloride channel homolog